MRRLQAIIVLAIAATASPGSAERLVLILGDSLTAGFGLPSAKAFPSRDNLDTEYRGHHA